MDKIYFEYSTDANHEAVYRRALPGGKYTFLVANAELIVQRKHDSFNDYWNSLVISNRNWHQFYFNYIHSELKPFIISELQKELQSHPGDNVIKKSIQRIKGR
ncbi:MAG: hypothetical protein M0D57_21025 [Sphingobacteriales bacterium JAD_PAG50586_3]|nr:MAG: hypothetical protein M0D57_21025 [Sphingobacteriales bacterium JAD_PAG50586_3]